MAVDRAGGDASKQTGVSGVGEAAASACRACGTRRTCSVAAQSRGVSWGTRQLVIGTLSSKKWWGIQLSTWPSHMWTSLTSFCLSVQGARSVAAEATHVDEVTLGVRRATCVRGSRDRTTGRAGAGWAGRGFVFGPRSAGGAGGRRTGPGDQGAVTPRHYAGRLPGVRCGAARALNQGRLECGVGSEPPGRPCGPHG